MTPCLLCDGTQTKHLFRKGGRSFLRCTGCGLVRVDPLPSENELASYYADTYDHGAYARFAAAADIRNLIAQHRLRLALRFARPGRWLDVGCGPGHFVEAARDAGIDAQGLDAAPGAGERARARGLNVRTQRVEDFEPGTPFDAITAFDVIEHTRDPGLFLERLGRWLVPGGTLVLTLPDVGSIYPRLLMRRHWFYYAPNDHLFYFDRRTIGRLARQRGFRIERIARAFKPMTVAYVVSQLGLFNPRLGRVAALLSAPLGERMRSRPVDSYLGEMLVVTKRNDDNATC